MKYIVHHSQRVNNTVLKYNPIWHMDMSLEFLWSIPLAVWGLGELGSPLASILHQHTAGSRWSWLRILCVESIEHTSLLSRCLLGRHRLEANIPCELVI